MKTEVEVLAKFLVHDSTLTKLEKFAMGLSRKVLFWDRVILLRSVTSYIRSKFRTLWTLNDS